MKEPVGCSPASIWRILWLRWLLVCSNGLRRRLPLTELVEAVATQITALDAALVAGSTLFAGRAPETPDRCVTVYEYSGTQAHYAYGVSEVLDQPRIQVLCRAARDDYGQAATDAHLIHEGLDAYGVTWSGISILRFVPLYTPDSIGPDETERPMISVRFEAVTSR